MRPAAAILAALLAAAPASHAGDSWSGIDKRQHLAGSVGLGIVAAGITETRTAAFGTCLGVGLGKELLDAAGMGQPSARDLTADAIGCALGVYTGRVFMRWSAGRAQLTYRTAF